MVWDPRLVRAMHARLEAANQAHWADVLARKLDFSGHTSRRSAMREGGRW